MAPLYSPYKCCLGVCLATCRSLNNVYTATSICMARNTVRPVHHLDCCSTDHFKCWVIQLLDNYFYSGVTLTTFIMTITFNNQCDFKGMCCQAYYNMWYAVDYKCNYKKCKYVIMQERLTSHNCYDDEIRPLEYWSIVQMATTVSCNTKSLIVGSGIRQWHSVGFLSWFTGNGTRKLVSLYLSAISFP